VERLLAVDTVQMAAPEDSWEPMRWFYGEVLGLPLLQSTPAKRQVYGIRNRRLEIEFRPRVQVNPNRRRAVLEVANLEEANRYLQSQGVRVEYYTGCSMATSRLFLKDPAGYWLELLQVFPL